MWTITTLFQLEQIYRLGTPKSVSAYPNFWRQVFFEILIKHGIKFKAKLSKTACRDATAECSNDVLETKLKRLSFEFKLF